MAKNGQKWPKMAKNDLNSHSGPGCIHKSLSYTIFDLTIGFPTLKLVYRLVESRPTYILWFLEDIIYGRLCVWLCTIICMIDDMGDYVYDYVRLCVWIISFRKREKKEMIESVCFPPASRLIWGWGIHWWGQKWSRTKIHWCDPDLNAFFSLFAWTWKPLVFWCSKLHSKFLKKAIEGLPPW